MCSFVLHSKSANGWKETPLNPVFPYLDKPEQIEVASIILEIAESYFTAAISISSFWKRIIRIAGQFPGRIQSVETMKHTCIGLKGQYQRYFVNKSGHTARRTYITGYTAYQVRLQVENEEDLSGRSLV